MIVCESCVEQILVLPLVILKRFILRCAICDRTVVDVSTQQRVS